MFTESEIEPDIDFVPKQNYNEGLLRLCIKCRIYTCCPTFFKCKTIKRWEKTEDMDNDNSL